MPGPPRAALQRGGVEVVVDFTVEIDGSAKPACVAQAVYRFSA
ncbi:hypothetical protein [Streptomyces sannanensis]